MGTVYCTSLPFGTSKKDLRDLFSPYGEIECVWITSSARAYVCFTDKGCAKNAIDGLNNIQIGGRKLIVEWSRSECHHRHAGEGPKRSPSAGLFVFNFDENSTETDLRRHFEQYGTVVKVRILGDNAFVDFESEQYATHALENTHNRNFRGKLLCVDYSGPSLRSPPQSRCERPDYNRYDFPSSYPNQSAWRSPPQQRGWSPDDNRYDFPSSYSRALRSPPQQRGWSPDYNRYDSPPSHSWWARRSRSPVYNRNDRLSYSRASSSVHRRYPSRSNSSGSRD